MARVGIFAVALLLIFQGAVSAHDGIGISHPLPLNTNADVDFGRDGSVALASDRMGTWIAIWESNDSLGGTIGDDYDILLSISTDNGFRWTPPRAVSADAGDDSDNEWEADLATSGRGTWIAVWSFGGVDGEIVFSRSVDLGSSWSDPQILSSNVADPSSHHAPVIAAGNDGQWVTSWWSDARGPVVSFSHDDGLTWSPMHELDPGANAETRTAVAFDGEETWGVAWSSDNDLGGSIGTDWDVLFSRSTDGGLGWSDPAALNPDAANDAQYDDAPVLASGGRGQWVAAWDKGGYDPLYWDYSSIQVARSSDGALSWEPSMTLNPKTDGFHWDRLPALATDGAGNWLVVWETDDSLEDLGVDDDLLFSWSSDMGRNWTAAEALNANARTDTGDDWSPDIASDGAGTWLVGWDSDRVYGPLERDLLRASVCGLFTPIMRYGELLFAPRCTRSASDLTQDAYESTRLAIARSGGDSYFLSGEGNRFAPLAVDDRLWIDGIDSGLGPYTPQPGVPPFITGVPVEHNLVMEQAHEVTALIPSEPREVSFELADLDREVFGNTPVYLVRDCGMFIESRGSTTLHFVSRQSPREGFTVVTGDLADLRTVDGFTNADCLGSFEGMTTDALPAPSPGTGRYYLGAGLEGCADVGYGESSVNPDRRVNLATVCPGPGRER